MALVVTPDFGVIVKIEFEEPKFKLGEKVWIVCGPNNAVFTNITSYHASIVEDHHEKMIAFAHAVRASAFISDDWFEDIDHDSVPFIYITKDEEEVKRWMKPWSVKMEEDEWFKMIGRRPTVEEMIKAAKEKRYDSEDSLDECELVRCCATIAEIRDVFIKCQEKGKITGWEREQLQELVNNHSKPEDTPLLNRALEQLQITWKEK